MPDEQSGTVDWMNLPHGVPEVSLWTGLHDAQIVSIQSNLLERTVALHLESDHLLEFHNLPPDMQFLLRLVGAHWRPLSRWNRNRCLILRMRRWLPWQIIPWRCASADS